MAFIFCAPALLKFTVLGIDELTFKVPAVMVSVPAIPKVELAVNCSDVPLIVVLKRLAVPLKVEVPVKVAVPAEAEKLPVTFRLLAMEKLTAVVTEPDTNNPAKALVPVPAIVLVVPLMVMIPALAVMLPLTDKLPVRLKEAALVIVPLTVRLSIEMPVPLIVLAVPVISNVPPLAWVREPDDMVARLPDTLMLPFENVNSDAETVRLLKFCVPDPLIPLPGPEKVMVPVLPLKVPLLIQLPATLCAKLPPLNVVEAPIVTLPVMVRMAAAVKLTELPAPSVLVRLPTIAKAVAAKVLTAAPLALLKVRLP